MRSIEGKLPSDIVSRGEERNIASLEPFQVNSFRELVEYVAKISYLNKDYLLFFRGQAKDYRNKSGSSTFYPSIYRTDYLTQREINYRFDLLRGASKLLSEKFIKNKIQGAYELKRKKFIQWSILQHYEVCSTPLLDFTHSLRVACSFAQLENNGNFAYVFVFGLPYITNRISINSEHDIVIVRLLSICPPEALRPYFQEGYLAGTEDIENEYESKSELDFKNRLIAKFKIPNGNRFWGNNFSAIPGSALFPKNDKVLEICNEIKEEVSRSLQSGDIGDFLKLWAEIEEKIIRISDVSKPRATIRDALIRLRKRKQFNPNLLNQIDRLRRFRNELVHKPKAVDGKTIKRYLELIDEVSAYLKQRNLFYES